MICCVGCGFRIGIYAAHAATARLAGTATGVMGSTAD